MTLPSTVTSREALRDTYRDELRRELSERKIDVVGGELDGVPVLTIPALDEAIAAVFDQPVPAAGETRAEVETPATVLVHAFCPKCGVSNPVNVSLTPELLVEPGIQHLRVKAKSKPRTHVCGQEALPLGDPIAEGQTGFDFDAIVGQTTEETIATRDAEPPDDLLDEDDDGTCGAEVAIPLVEGEGPTESGMLELVCHRAMDHDGDHFDRLDDVAWHFETVPVPQGIVGNEDAPVGDQGETAADAEEEESDGEAND